MYDMIPMYFEFIKQIETPKNSIFYSMIPYQDNSNRILAVGRRRYDERILKFMILDQYLNVIKDNQTFLVRGEDPRCFYHNNFVYIQDNYWNDLHLINLTTRDDIKIDIDGKNLSFISHNDRLYFIHFMCPFSLYELCLETGEIFPVEVYQEDYVNYEYRGGTPAYKLCDDVYYGFGHRTFTNFEGVLLHDVFYWEVHFTHDKPFIQIWNIEQPPGSLNLCDPTCVITLNNRNYLVTAESEYPWFQDQEYITNVYEIIKD